MHHLTWFSFSSFLIPWVFFHIFFPSFPPSFYYSFPDAPSFCDLSLYFGFFRNCVLSFSPASGCSASFTLKAEPCLAKEHIHRYLPELAPQLTAARAPASTLQGSCTAVSWPSQPSGYPSGLFVWLSDHSCWKSPALWDCMPAVASKSYRREHIQTSNFTPSGVSNLLYFYPPLPSPGFTDWQRHRDTAHSYSSERQRALESEGCVDLESVHRNVYVNSKGGV